MESKEGASEESWTKLMPFMVSSQTSVFTEQLFDVTNSHQSEQNWETSSMIDYGAVLESFLSKLDQTSKNLPSLAGCSTIQNKFSNTKDDGKKEMPQNGETQDWDPRAMLSNLSFLEQKIHQLQELVHMFVGRKVQVPTCTDEFVTQQQQLITADVTSIVVQLISMAGSLLPPVKNSPVEANPLSGVTEQSNGFIFPPATSNGGSVKENVFVGKSLDQTTQLDHDSCMDDHELKDEDEPNDEEHLPPGSYEILQLEKEEILAPHTHFCTVCGKGFKRDANLRMHMRGHGDEYKTPAALAKPHKDSNSSEPVLPKRYSCPYLGCKRNKEHKKFQALKTILCVKNHYKRTHCDKTYTCSRCNTKKFSVLADLKTHEKHCGREKWLCSCGTTFSRKDKLFGHIALFQGHTPAIPIEPNKALAGTPSNPVENNEASNNKVGSMDFSFASDNSFGIGTRNIMDDSYFSLTSFDGCNILQELSQSAFDDPGTPFPFLLSESKSGLQSGSDDIDS